METQMKGRLLSTLTAGLVALTLSGMAFAAKIDLNTADVTTLAEGISGVGPKLAERIVEWREQYGPFTSVDQLTEVSGIGEKILSDNQENLSVEASSE
jgi:competence protein ComEA